MVIKNISVVLICLFLIISTFASAEEIQKRITIKELVDEALQNNPEIIASRYSLEAMKAIPSQASSWPDPEVSISIEKIPEGSLDIKEAEKIYSLSQSFPFPGKPYLRGKIAQWEVEKSSAQYRATVLRVIAQLKLAYYDLYLINKSIEITNKNIDILKNLAKTAESRYAVGKGIQQDVVRAQVELSRLYETLEILKGKKEATEALIRSILNRPPQASIGIPEDIRKTEFNFDFSELLDIALKQSPELYSVKTDVEKNKTSLELARREYFPDFNAKLAMRQMDGSITGYDAMVGMSIPIYFYWKQKKGVEEKTNFLSEALKRQEAAVQSITFRLRDLYVKIKTSDRVLSLYEKAIIPQAVISFESAIKAYETGLVDFLTPLESLIRLLNDELSYYTEFTNYQQNIARIEEIIDREIIK